MKKSVLFVAFATIVLAFSSCGSNNEWQKFYGYTPNDIAGEYIFSNQPDAFQSLTEGEFCHLCKDAIINIVPSNENNIRFEMVCEDENYHKIYVGKAPLNSHDFMIDIKGNVQPISSTSFNVFNLNSRVYHNAEGKIRLEGNSACNRYNVKQNIIYDSEHVPVDTTYDTTLYSSTRYYFDVIKN